MQFGELATSIYATSSDISDVIRNAGVRSEAIGERIYV